MSESEPWFPLQASGTGQALTSSVSSTAWAQYQSSPCNPIIYAFIFVMTWPSLDLNYATHSVAIFLMAKFHPVEKWQPPILPCYADIHIALFAPPWKSSERIFFLGQLTLLWWSSHSCPYSTSPPSVHKNPSFPIAAGHQYHRWLQSRSQGLSSLKGSTQTLALPNDLWQYRRRARLCWPLLSLLRQGAGRRWRW